MRVRVAAMLVVGGRAGAPPASAAGFPPASQVDRDRYIEAVAS